MRYALISQHPLIEAFSITGRRRPATPTAAPSTPSRCSLHYFVRQSNISFACILPSRKLLVTSGLLNITPCASFSSDYQPSQSRPRHAGHIFTTIRRASHAFSGQSPPTITTYLRRSFRARLASAPYFCYFSGRHASRDYLIRFNAIALSPVATTAFSHSSPCPRVLSDVAIELINNKLLGRRTRLRRSALAFTIRCHAVDASTSPAQKHSFKRRFFQRFALSATHFQRSAYYVPDIYRRHYYYMQPRAVDFRHAGPS